MIVTSQGNKDSKTETFAFHLLLNEHIIKRRKLLILSEKVAEQKTKFIK